MLAGTSTIRAADETAGDTVSLTPQGPDWWEASDRRWYPPEQHPGAMAGPPSMGVPSSPTSVPQTPVTPDPVLVILPERARQRRWTVLLRWILAIPMAILVAIVGIATFVVVILGWFAAVFTGRVPAFVRDVVTEYLRVNLRLQSYGLLLTDRFPPLRTGEVAEFPAHLAVPGATTMSRASVFFRIILIIPAGIVSTVVQYGLIPIAFVMWFVVLITGWLPKSAHDAFRAVVRYQTRVAAYVLLLVPAYPGELFGDANGPLVQQEPPPGGPFGAGGTPPATPSPWGLLLERGAKRLLVVMIVLGVLLYGGVTTLRVINRDRFSLIQENNTLVGNIKQFVDTSNQCRASNDPIPCLERNDGEFSSELQNFVNGVQGKSAVGVSQQVIDQVTAAAANSERVTAVLAEAGPTAADYESAVTRTNGIKVLDGLSAAQTQLRNALNGSRFG
jgi:hypothetical protein